MGTMGYQALNQLNVSVEFWSGDDCTSMGSLVERGGGVRDATRRVCGEGRVWGRCCRERGD